MKARNGMYNVRKSWRAQKLKFCPLKFDVSVGLETTKSKAAGRTQRIQNANFAVPRFSGVTATNGLNKNLQDTPRCCTCEQDTRPKNILKTCHSLGETMKCGNKLFDICCRCCCCCCCYYVVVMLLLLLLLLGPPPEALIKWVHRGAPGWQCLGGQALDPARPRETLLGSLRGFQARRVEETPVRGGRDLNASLENPNLLK